MGCHPQAIKDCIQEIKCDTAYDMLLYLHVSNDRWFQSIPGWIYRGQRCACWPLMPSAFRKKDYFQDCFSSQESSLPENPLPHNDVLPDALWDLLIKVDHQITCEKWSIEEFIREADNIGHPIPDDLKSLRLFEYVEYSLTDLVITALTENLPIDGGIFDTQYVETDTVP